MSSADFQNHGYHKHAGSLFQRLMAIDMFGRTNGYCLECAPGRLEGMCEGRIGWHLIVVRCGEWAGSEAAYHFLEHSSDILSRRLTRPENPARSTETQLGSLLALSGGQQIIFNRGKGVKQGNC